MHTQDEDNKWPTSYLEVDGSGLGIVTPRSGSPSALWTRSSTERISCSWPPNSIPRLGEWSFYCPPSFTRNLYWQYCQSIPRRSWHANDKEENAKEEFGKKSWGSRGRYMQINMLRAFVLEMGHEYEHFLNKATEISPGNESNPMALTAANTAIFPNLRKNEGLDDDMGILII